MSSSISGQIARDSMRHSIPDALWSKNQEFVARLQDMISRHPISVHPAISALNQATFEKAATCRIHLEYRHAIVQEFTDALLMAQYQCRQLEPRLQAGQKMAARFLLTFNILDEFGFQFNTSTSEPDGYCGTPYGAHYPLYERVLNELDISLIERSEYVPSPIAHRLLQYLRSSYESLSAVTSLLAVAERVVVLFSAPMRQNAKASGVTTTSGYYLCHGESSDPQSEADDDVHESDLWQVLTQSLLPQEYEYIESLCREYCDLWVEFWDLQMHNLIPNYALEVRE